MKRILKRAPALLLALCLLLPAFAALAEVDVQADKTAVQAGDSVSVTFTVTGKNLAVAQGSFTYDPALLSFSEGEGASDGIFALYSAQKDGASSLSARISFTALAAGEATVAFALESLTNYAGKALDTGSASLTISIAAAPATPTPPPIDYSDPALSIPAQNVQGATGALYVWRSIENVTIPSRYAEADVLYRGETVKGALVTNADAPTLVYLSDAAGENAGYYIYDEARDLLYPYRSVSSVSKNYILLAPEDTVSVPEGFAPTTLMIGDVAVQAWSRSDAQGEVYLLYARNPAGEIGFYFYDPADESLQRYAVLPARPAVSAPATPTPTPQAPQIEEPAPETFSVSPILFYGICAAAALLFGLLIAVLLVHHRENVRRERRAAERKKALSVER